MHLPSTIGICEGKGKVGMSKLLSCAFSAVRLKLGSVAVRTAHSLPSINRQFLGRAASDRVPAFHIQLGETDLTWNSRSRAYPKAAPSKVR
jgi:hypothetical protein